MAVSNFAVGLEHYREFHDIITHKIQNTMQIAVWYELRDYIAVHSFLIRE